MGTYIVLATPDGEQPPSPEAPSQRLDAAEGLLRASFGGAVVYQQAFENLFDLTSGQTVLHFTAVDNPAWLDLPNLDQSARHSAQKLNAAIQHLDQSEATRIHLALRWLANAGRSRGIDAFLKYWVALETLAFPEGETNVRHAEQLIRSGYEIDHEEVRARFCFGKLHGIRSGIVHNGATPRIPGECSKFLEALFLDLLAVSVGLPCPKRAAAMEIQGDFTWSAWVNSCASTSS